MRQTKTVKIQLDNGDSEEVVEKEFTVKELSIKSIIALSQSNAFFSDSKDEPEEEAKKDENGPEPDKGAVDKGAGVSLYEELSGIGEDIGKVMEETCDFTMADMVDLYPSDVKDLYEAFQEVNQTFLDVLRKLKILDMFLQVMERAFANFSGMLAI